MPIGHEKAMAAPTPASPVEKPHPCIARQPILGADENVFGYELLFREDPGQDRFVSDFGSATCKTIDSLNAIGLEVLCDGALAFVNCEHQMLVKEYFFSVAF